MTIRRLTNDASAITGQMEKTPEGFLICRNVPLARTGEQIYLSHEVPELPAKNGQVIAQRDDDQVFDVAAIESFRGKPLTDDHPFEDVDPKNFKNHLVGTVMNPRRGDGAFANCVVGDLIVYDQGAIAKIIAGKRELSCGYDAGYEVIEPGRARQINIRGNHVSLVDEGRCGPICAIRDKGKHMASNAKQKPSWFDRLAKAVRAKDEAEREEHLAAAEAEMPGDDGDHDGDGHHIVLNITAPASGGADTPKPKDGEGNPEEGTDMDEDKINELVGTAIDEKLAPVMEAIKSLSDKFDATSTKAVEAGEKADALAEQLEDMTDPDDMGMQDAIARAEILAPGLTLPARDAKPGSKAHRDAMGHYQRSALKQALTTDAGRAIVNAVLGHAQPSRIATMPSNEIAVAFRAASQIMLDHNANSAVSTLASATAGTFRDTDGKVKPLDNRTWNEINAKHFGRKA
jgi:hypothetical protein